jgi:hypothetical protein
VVVAGERWLVTERVDDRQTGGGPLRHCDRHRTVQLDDGRRCEPSQRAVQLGDSGPVGVLRCSGARVTGRDRRLKSVGAEAAQRFRAGERGESPPDEELIPTGAVLIQQEHRLARGSHTGAEPRGLDLHQRHQAVHFRLPRREPRQDSPQTQRLFTERRPHPVVAGGGGIAFVEDQVDDLQHRRQPRRQLVASRHLERHPRLGEGPLGAHDALRQRRLRDEEGARDLLGGEPSEEPERERHAGFSRQHRVAGDEDEAQQVVADLIVEPGIQVRGLVPVLQLVAELPLLAVVQRAAAQRVDRAMLRRGHEPGTGPLGHSGPGPALQRGHERILRQVLRQPDIAHDAGEGGDEPGGLDSPDRLDGPVGIGCHG